MGWLDIFKSKSQPIQEQAPSHTDEKIRALKQLTENFNNQPDLFSSLYDRYYSGGQWWGPVTGMPALGGTSNKTQGRDSYNFYTEQDLRFQRDAARLLFGREPIAKAIEGHLNAFVVGSGFTYRIMPNKQNQESFSPEILEQYQQYIDDWMEEQQWKRREKELFTCQVVDGEWFLRLFRSQGKLQVRRIEPEHIQNKPGAAFRDGWYLGVKVNLSDVEIPLAYGYKPDYVEWKEIPAKEIIHLKDNVTRNVSRGISAFWPVLDDINSAANLADNMRAGAAARSELAYMCSVKNATPAAINAFRDTIKDQSVTSPTTHKTIYSKGMSAGKVAIGSDNLEYTTMPAGDSDAYIAVLQAALRIIANRWLMPEYFTGDASNANYSSTLVAGGPFVRYVESVQSFVKSHIKPVMDALLDQMVASGVMAVNDRQKLNIEIGCDSPVIHDELADAQAKDILRRNGVLSPQEWVAADGRDWEDVQRDLDTWNERNMQTPDLGQSAGTTAFGAQQAEKQQQGEDNSVSQSSYELASSLMKESQWEENKHPRADDGKFGSGGGSASDTAKVKSEEKPDREKQIMAKAKAIDALKKEFDVDDDKVKEMLSSKKKIKKTSTAEVSMKGQFGVKHEEKVQERLKELFPDWDDSEMHPGELIASVTGMPDDATRFDTNVSFTDEDGNIKEDGKFLKVSVIQKGLSMERLIGKDANGVFIENKSFMLKKKGTGLGADLFSKQVEAASSAGITEIRCHAACEDSDGKRAFNGYYSWPRMGYDQPLEGEGVYEADAKIYNKAKEEFPGAKTVLDIMETEEGRSWWKKNGTDMLAAKFDLSEGSRSMKIHQAYIQAKKSKTAT